MQWSAVLLKSDASFAQFSRQLDSACLVAVHVLERQSVPGVS